MIEQIRGIFLHVLDRLGKLFKWVMFSIYTGIVLGIVCALFTFLLRKGIAYREGHPVMIFLLPVAGLIIVGLYQLMDYKNDEGTNLVLESIQSDRSIPMRMTPLIFMATIITHLFGGSSGREGAALQIGAGTSEFLGTLFNFNNYDRRIFIMSGMSAAFSAVFGTPVAATIFAMEVINVGTMYYSALVPCTISALMASAVAVRLGNSPEHYIVQNVVDFSPNTAIATIFLACICAGVSVLFCILLHKTSSFFKKSFTNPYIRVFVGGTLIVIFTVLIRTREYSGTGAEIIERAIDGEAVPYAFILKMLFTAVTLGCGFKGGEIVPSFFIGATLGCTFGHIAGLSPSLCASIGMVSLFCGVTNCPLSSLIIALELFGMDGLPYYLLAIAISYMLSGYYGLYHSQRFAFSKYKAKYVDNQAHE